MARTALLRGTRSTTGHLPCPAACREPVTTRPPSVLILPLLRRGREAVAGSLVGEGSGRLQRAPNEAGVPDFVKELEQADT